MIRRPPGRPIFLLTLVAFLWPTTTSFITPTSMGIVFLPHGAN